MSVYVVTGKLGNGKTLASVGRITEYLRRGSKVATNLDLYLEHFDNPRLQHKNIIRLPDKPTAENLRDLGKGTDQDDYDESKFGILVLDECGTWFNSRNWNDKGRADVVDWFLHSRKLGWDVLLVVQDISILDKQARETLAEYTVFCRRMDRFRIPILSPLVKMATGYALTLPKIHIGIVKYGDNATYPTVDRWWYMGKSVYKLYETRQVFTHYNDGNYCLLDPYTIKGRYLPTVSYLDYFLKAISFPVSLAAYAVLSLWAMSTGRSPADIAREWRRSQAV